MSRSNRERTEQTRQALIAAGRRLFVEKGYAETATPEIVAAAGVTRGALYHHFEDKKALFRAVIECEAKAVAEAIEARSGSYDAPHAGLIAGTSSYFDAMMAQGRTRLLLIGHLPFLARWRAQRSTQRMRKRRCGRGLQRCFRRPALCSNR